MNFLEEFTTRIDYDRLEIYSYNRGDMLKFYLQELEEERNRLLQLIEIETDFDRELEINKRVKQIQKYEPLLDVIYTKEKGIQRSARLIEVIKDDNPLFFEVKGILETPVKEPIASRCTEEFRDGIVFKKEDEIVDSLSICFHCAMIRMTSCKGEVFADKSFYDDYRNILARLGQDVDER